jgi:hypothetical protein
LAGEDNRERLAQRFKWPTQWRDYCEQVSLDNCSTTDNTTSRAPLTVEEGDHYYLNDVYNGHFLYTDENNCTLNPGTCTGQFLDYPCGWTSFFVQQAHHLNIGLSGSGDECGSRGYSYSEMVQVWHAANYTKSDVIGWWWCMLWKHVLKFSIQCESKKWIHCWPILTIPFFTIDLSTIMLALQSLPQYEFK